MAVLAKGLGAQVHQLVLGLDVVDADLALLYQFLHGKIPQCNVLCARTLGAVAGDAQRHAAEALMKVQLQHHVGAEHRLFRCQSFRYELCLHRGLCGQPLQFHRKADGMYDDVYLPLSELLPQLVSEKPASLKAPCLR